jgi:hypothetical protein
VRAAAAKEALHGPLDWDHFNKRGYTVLAEALAAALARPDPNGRCSTLAAAPAGPAQ